MIAVILLIAFLITGCEDKSVKRDHIIRIGVENISAVILFYKSVDPFFKLFIFQYIPPIQNRAPKYKIGQQDLLVGNLSLDKHALGFIAVKHCRSVCRRFLGCILRPTPQRVLNLGKRRFANTGSHLFGHPVIHNGELITQPAPLVAIGDSVFGQVVQNGTIL